MRRCATSMSSAEARAEPGWTRACSVRPLRPTAAPDAAAILFGSGVSRGTGGRDGATALADLALLTGNVGRPGTGLYPLSTTRPTAQGLEGHGCGRLAARGTGKAPSGDPRRNRSRGRSRFLYVVGNDPALAVADEARTRASPWTRCPFLVVQDSFLTDTAT